MDIAKNILLPTDFSKESENAISYTIDLLKKTNGKISLLNVCNVPLKALINNSQGIEITREEQKKKMRTRSLNRLKELISENDLEDYKHRCFVREGTVNHEITKVQTENHIDLVIMGTHGKNAEKGLFVERTTKSVYRRLTCPLLAIPVAAEFNSISKIVYTTDLLNDDTDVIKYLVEFAKLYDATITILHIDHDDSNKEWSIEKLKKLIDKTAYPRIAYREMIIGDVVSGINEYINDRNVDLLAMTTFSTTLFEKIFRRSVTKQLLLNSPIPLLLFNAKRHEPIHLGQDVSMNH